MVAEVFGNVLGNLFGGFMGQQANAQGVLLSAQEQKKLMDHQAKVNWKYYQKELQNRWQLAREGLEKGNYNPMLALQGINGNSSWTNQASISDTGAGTAFNAGMANAQGVAQLRQQSQLNDSTIDLNNASAYKAEQEAMTEAYKQLEMINHADLMQSEKTLTDKRSNNFEREQAREDRKVSLYGEEVANQLKIGMYNALTNRINSTINQQNANTNANALDVQKNTRTDTVSLHGPLGIGTSVSTTGYKPNKVNQVNKRPVYTYENINGRKVRVRNY